MQQRTRTLLAASVAGLLAAVGTTIVSAEDAKAPDNKPAHCYGVNKCKGAADCSGKMNSCAGHNACKGQGYIDMKKDTCLRIEGGRLTEGKS